VEERGCEPPPAVSGELGVTPGMPIVCVGHICPELRFSLRAVCAARSSLAADRVQSARVAVSSTDCRPCRIASTSPGRLELGAERHDQQHGKAADTLDGEVEQLARGVGADVSVQPGFVIIIPYRRKRRVLLFVVLPWTLRMTSATKRPQSERYAGQNDANIWSGQKRRDHGKLVDALWVGK
jgi:hypothetical protein